MVTLNEEMTIASPPDAVWPLLRDPAVVAGCIPGAELSADSEDGVWRGSIRVKFGPTVAQFRGEATLEFDDQTQRVTIDGRGIDGRGASRALANSVVELHVVELHGEHATTMKVAGEFTVTGPLEPFVNAGGVHVARALLSEFCNNIAAAVEAFESEQADATGQAAAEAGSAMPPAATETRATPGASSAEAASSKDRAATAVQSADAVTPLPAQPQRPAAELNASALLWRALCTWIKNFFGKGN